LIPGKVESQLRLLLIEDDKDLGDTLKEYLEADGLSVTVCESCKAALDLLRDPDSNYPMILTDLLLPDGDGFEIIRASKERDPDALAAVMTGYASLQTAVEAIRLGAYDYITKPFSLDEIDILLKNMKDKLTLQKEHRDGQRKLHQVYSKVETLQDEKMELMRLNREMRREFESLSEKLDQVIQLLSLFVTTNPDSNPVS
jgi:DNA-binding NtrC family response regulator